jgi:hypothetical protein
MPPVYFSDIDSLMTGCPEVIGQRCVDTFIDEPSHGYPYTVSSAAR